MARRSRLGEWHYMNRNEELERGSPLGTVVSFEVIVHQNMC